MPRPALEVADLFRRHGPAYRAAQGTALAPGQRRVMQAIETCRTAALGGHVEQCDQCGHRTTVEEDRGREPAPTLAGTGPAPRARAWPRPSGWRPARRSSCRWRSFHVVFTGPESVGAVALQNQRVVYSLVFHAAAETLRRIAADPQPLGAEIGFLAVLHTGGQNLLPHPHLHGVVPGGGLAPDGQRWVPGRLGFCLPGRVLSRLFRRLCLDALPAAFDQGRLELHGPLAPLADPPAFRRLLAAARATHWVVYAKPPCGGPAPGLDYLGRYTPRVALANHRLVALEDRRVTLRWKDYRQGHRPGTLTLDAGEFIRRFLLHVLPDGFVRIRHFGCLSNRHRAAKLARCRALLGGPAAPDSPPPPPGWTARYAALTGEPVDRCPACRPGRLRRVATLPPLASLPAPPSPGLDSS
jgi:hypothetical protein